jgi:hypothetical protein
MVDENSIVSVPRQSEDIVKLLFTRIITKTIVLFHSSIKNVINHFSLLTNWSDNNYKEIINWACNYRVFFVINVFDGWPFSRF